MSIMVSREIEARDVGPLAPLLRGEGWGEGLFEPQKLNVRRKQYPAPHPTGFAALRRSTSPRAERGEVTLNIGKVRGSSQSSGTCASLPSCGGGPMVRRSTT